MTASGRFRRYVERRQRRIDDNFTNPWVMAPVLAFLWIFFRWWPAVVMTIWLGVCVALSVRSKRRRRAGRSN
jgi:hypothetical protein